MARAGVAYLLPGDVFPEAWPNEVGVAQTVRESDPDRRTGLIDALQTIAAGHAEVLLVQRLGATARSLADLIRLLDWLEAHQASLVAIDVRLDTGRAEGRRAALVLREIDRWAREPDAPRRPRGRPGLHATAPAVAKRIALLREQGLSLHAIAEALNGEGVPTPRGGARWRASGVQSALGYRRPRPPAPGLPPPGPRSPHGPRAGHTRRTPGPPGGPRRKGPS
jgi:DNA invertase Pin-like site-specific DNA recombinase